MDIEVDEAVLLKFAEGGTIDYSSWPQLLPTIISRLEKIVHNEFPIPQLPPPAAPPPPESRFLAPLPSSSPAEPPSSSAGGPDSALSQVSSSSSQETNKENANPAPTPAGPGAAPQQPAQPADPASPLEPGALPPPLAAALAEITTTLADGFPAYPPHTMQRLAELLLAPRQHYRSLPAYLHAVDRVVHVTSGMNVYPLPPAIPDMSAMSLLANGTPAAAAAPPSAVGSDEALGGALLTPIPWLQRRTNGGSVERQGSGSLSPSSDGSGGSATQGTGQSSSQQQIQGQVRTESTETIDGPNGVGSIETVSVSVNGIPSTGAAGLAQQQQQQPRALTQGEILRQEQRAGVVPVTQLARSSPAATSTAGGPAGGAHLVHLGGSSSPSQGASRDGTSAESGGAGAASAAEDEDMADDETPHARGPAEIDAADTGPQSGGSSYIVGSTPGGVELHGIDVEAAVGRRAEQRPGRSSRSPPEEAAQQQQTTQQQKPEEGRADASPEGSVVPAKREAGEEIDVKEGHAQKKLKDEAAGGAAAGDGRAKEGEGEEQQGPGEAEPKQDADGDIELADQANDPTAEGGAASEGSSATVGADSGSGDGVRDDKATDS
ncbi:PPP4R2 domain protein [Pleurostoma richardsiae]|uniref:PPP4R2 domain protein n=1 Tax=Pleurostoma richardsiae TaxID=41990 RepID=A0AA38RKD7_9PEZI|nr:PPP4R2 domain protein [Pleurostoma richardsiae]